MRVEVVFDPEEPTGTPESPSEGSEQGSDYVDLRAKPRAIEQLDVARRHPPLRNFLVAVNGPNSVFATTRCKTWLNEDPAAEGAAWEFISRIDVVFANQTLNSDRAAHEDLTRRLEELLLRDASPETLRAELRFHRCPLASPDRAGFCVQLLLYARGATPEQAELRWGLGLARLQQALLFTSRTLRQPGERLS